MRNFTLLTVSGFCLCVAASVLKAQEKKSPWSFGVKAGVNTPTNNDGYSSNGNGNAFGFTGGFTVEYDLGNRFYLSSRLEYANKGFEYDSYSYAYSNLDNSTGTSDQYSYSSAYTSVRQHTLQIPLTVGYRLPVSRNANLTFRAGAYVSYGIAASSQIESHHFQESNGKYTSSYSQSHSNDYDDSGLQRFDYGLLGGIGFEYKRFSINADYQSGLKNLTTHKGHYYHSNGNDHIGGAVSGLKTRNLSLSVGYKF